MEKLLKRLNSASEDHYEAMKMYARCFGIPFIEEDLIELMEFWADVETQTITITLVLDQVEIYRKIISNQNTSLYVEMTELFIKELWK